jgi:CRISPR/Cas system-associated exonuclease Cas4 (RecB family)
VVAVVLGLLIAALLGLLCLGLDRWLGARRRRLGIAPGGRLVATDDSRDGLPTLSSPRLGLVGRPDELVRVGEVLIPVEHKPRAQRAQASHHLQLAAQCALVADVFGVRPPYGVLVLADGEPREVPFTRELEARLLETTTRMRALLAAGDAPGRRWVAPKCQRCAYFPVCWE